MHFTVRKTELIVVDGSHLKNMRVTIELDSEGREILGRLDPRALLGTIDFDFAEHTSEAAMLSAIRNELASKRLKAQSVNRLAHLIGKRFEF